MFHSPRQCLDIEQLFGPTGSDPAQAGNPASGCFTPQSSAATKVWRPRLTLKGPAALH